MNHRPPYGIQTSLGLEFQPTKNSSLDISFLRTKGVHLGSFFNVWGVLLTPDCIGGYCNSGPDVLRVYVNGKQVTTDVTKLPLTQHEYILVTYGTTAQLPSPIPSTYSKNISSSCAGSC